MAVILLHAIGLDAGSWTFAAIPGAIALDLPGLGAQPLPAKGLHLPDMADDVIRRAPQGPLDIVGVSMGAQVAMQIALRHGDRVRSLLVANSGPAANPEVMRQRAEAVKTEGLEKHAQGNIDRWFTERARAAEQPAIAYAISCLMRDSLESLRAGWLAVSEHNVSDRLVDLAMPVTVLAATEDKAAPVAALEAMQRAISKSRFEVIEGPHLAYMEAPDAFRSAVARHLAWASV